MVERDKIITIFILFGLFSGLVGGPVASLADYYAPPVRRFWLFIIPEFIGFAYLVLMIILPAGWEAISSQFRVWPLPPTIIVTFGERNRNPGHHFAGINII